MTKPANLETRSERIEAAVGKLARDGHQPREIVEILMMAEQAHTHSIRRSLRAKESRRRAKA